MGLAQDSTRATRAVGWLVRIPHDLACRIRTSRTRRPVSTARVLRGGGDGWSLAHRKRSRASERLRRPHRKTGRMEDAPTKILPVFPSSGSISPTFRGLGTLEMSERRQRRWSWWVAKGAVAMAVLAALSLAATVRFAQIALVNAADVVVRGDGDALVAGVVVDLWEAQWPVTSDALAQVLAKHQAQRLRYVALV